ncbi:MAG TPA: DUF5000 domain-containing lipoprotein [Bacteroidales bacterium]|nr:DUF5000 domain-containing lipoprotein [Bacteroidales bacterium]
MKNFKSYLMLGMLLFSISACNQDILGPIPNDGSVPGPISNPVVQNLPGAAMITYNLPSDASLLYVKAEYMFKGAKVNVISSYYKKSILLEGFADTTALDVTLYAVSRGEKASTPVTIQIKPLESPLVNIMKTLQVKESFGGFIVKIKNPNRSNVVLGVLRKDTLTNEWVQIDAYYTSLDSVTFSTRGLDSINQEFGFFAKDRWDNKTDTLSMEIKPIYEVRLDGTKFVDIRKKFPIPQIAPLPASGKPMAEMVDYNSSYVWKNAFDGNTTSMFHTKQNYDQPTWLPIDLGKMTRLSRYKIWQRTGSFIFNHGNPHQWEIWGTNTPADVKSWVLLTADMSIKPSGSPLGVNTPDDVDASTNGQEFMMPEGVGAYRYIAWKNIDSWASIEAGTGFFHVYELGFWGQIINN